MSSKKISQKITSQHRPQRFIIGGLFISVFVGVGTLIMLQSIAATPTVALEIETGTVSGSAQVITTTSASGGKAIAFGSKNHATICGWGVKPSTYKHVVWIWMENKDQTAVIGKANYIDSIKSACGSATNVQDNATSATLPSEPQYAAATSGSNCNTGITTTGTNCIVNDNDYSAANSLSTVSIFQQVKSSGGTWKTYQESMPTNCALTSSRPLYVYKHNPAAFYTQISADCKLYDVGFPGITCTTTASGTCTVPSGILADDIKNGTLPTFSFITPNMDNDMHDGTVAQGDNWLKTYLNLFIAGSNYQSGDTAIFIMWDEGSSNTGSSTTAIPTLIIAPSIAAGTVTTTQTNNIGLLRTTQELLGLTPYLGCANGTPPGSVGTCGSGSTVSLRASLGL